MKEEDVFLIMLELFENGKTEQAASLYCELDDGDKFAWSRILWSHYGDFGLMAFRDALYRVMNPVSKEVQYWLDLSANAVGKRPYTLEEMKTEKARWQYE